MRQLLASLIMLMAAWNAAAADTATQADVTAGREKAQPCAACHGQTGVSPSGMFPNLAGQKASYLVKQLEEIRDGGREVPQMTGQLDSFSDQDIRNVAAFYAEQTPPLGEADPDEELVAHGRELYRAGDLERGLPACSACHTPTGAGIGSAAYPALSGQKTDYTIAALRAFAEGNRDNDPNGIMRDIAAKLNERDMNALANYLLGLH